MGEVPIDAAAVDRLRENPLVSASNLFSHEHGVRALLPFVAHYFPRARVVAVALHRDSQPSQWDSLAQTLAPLLTADTLLIQSTDFSHYLPWPQARRYDQETLRVLSVGDPDGGGRPQTAAASGFPGGPIPPAPAPKTGVSGPAGGDGVPQLPGIYGPAA